MSSTPTTPNSTQLVAFFRDREDAFQAINDLREQGFSVNEIGFAAQGDTQSAGTSRTGTSSEHTDKSMWQKMKDFFTGGDEDNDSAYQNSDLDDSYRHMNFSDDQWQYYRSGMNQGGAIVTIRADADRLARAREIVKEHDADLRTSGFDRSEFATSTTGGSRQRTGSMTDRGEQKLQLRGELLRTFKERIATGEVRLRKEVVSQNQTINVPVTREEVVIERVTAGEGEPISGNVADIGKGQEIRIPVSEERVRVEKQPVVTGEVRVAKRAVQNTEQVNDTVRHEEVRVEKDGDINVEDATSTKRKKPAA